MKAAIQNSLDTAHREGVDPTDLPTWTSSSSTDLPRHLASQLREMDATPSVLQEFGLADTPTYNFLCIHLSAIKLVGRTTSNPNGNLFGHVKQGLVISTPCQELHLPGLNAPSEAPAGALAPAATTPASTAPPASLAETIPMLEERPSKIFKPNLVGTKGVKCEKSGEWLGGELENRKNPLVPDLPHPQFCNHPGGRHDAREGRQEERQGRSDAREPDQGLCMALATETNHGRKSSQGCRTSSGGPGSITNQSRDSQRFSKIFGPEPRRGGQRGQNDCQHQILGNLERP